MRADAAQCAHLAGVHGLAAARRLHHGVEALGGAEVTLGQLQLVLLLGLQSRFQVLLLPVLQELQLLCRCSKKETSTQTRRGTLQRAVVGYLLGAKQNQ